MVALLSIAGWLLVAGGVVAFSPRDLTATFLGVGGLLLVGAGSIVDVLRDILKANKPL